MSKKKPSKFLIGVAEALYVAGDFFDPRTDGGDCGGSCEAAPVAQPKQPAPSAAETVEAFWGVYGNSCGWKAVNGAPLPTWGKLCAERPEVAAHWRKVAEYAIISLADTVYLNKSAVAPKSIKVNGARAATYEITDVDFSPEGDLTIRVKPAPVPRKEKPDTTTPEHPVVAGQSEGAQADPGE